MIRKTRITRDWGLLFHFLFGFFATFLGHPWLFTLIFLFKQLILDLIAGGEDPSIVSGDLAEYSAGLVAGALVRFFLPFFL